MKIGNILEDKLWDCRRSLKALGTELVWYGGQGRTNTGGNSMLAVYKVIRTTITCMYDFFSRRKEETFCANFVTRILRKLRSWGRTTQKSIVLASVSYDLYSNNKCWQFHKCFHYLWSIKKFLLSVWVVKYHLHSGWCVRGAKSFHLSGTAIRWLLASGLLRCLELTLFFLFQWFLGFFTTASICWTIPWHERHAFLGLATVLGLQSWEVCSTRTLCQRSHCPL